MERALAWGVRDVYWVLVKQMKNARRKERTWQAIASHQFGRENRELERTWRNGPLRSQPARHAQAGNCGGGSRESDNIMGGNGGTIRMAIIRVGRNVENLSSERPMSNGEEGE